MGLLNKINAVEPELSSTALNYTSGKSNSVGLLRKSMMLSQANKLDFFSFTRKYNIQKAAIFSLHNNDYLISECIGLDSETIIKSISSKDFWDGIITQKNKFFLFKKEDASMAPFYQFFSEKIRLDSDFDSIYINHFSDKEILIILTFKNQLFLDETQLNHINSEILSLEKDFCKKNISQDFFDSSYSIYSLKTNNLMNKILSEQSNYSNELKSALYFCIYCQLFKFCTNKEIIIKPNPIYDEYLFVISDRVDFNLKLLVQHSIIIIKDLLNLPVKQVSENIQFLFIETTDNLEKINNL